MKDHVDKSMGIVTRLEDVLTRIKPTESLRLAKCESHKKRNWSHSSGNSPAKILTSRWSWKKNCRTKSSVYLTIMPNLHSDCLVEGVISLRSTGGGSIGVMSHCDIHHDCNSVTNRVQQQTEPILYPIRALEVLQIDADTSEYDHRKYCKGFKKNCL
jgi:hypothetical protein